MRTLLAAALCLVACSSAPGGPSTGFGDDGGGGGSSSGGGGQSDSGGGGQDASAITFAVCCSRTYPNGVTDTLPCDLSTCPYTVVKAPCEQDGEPNTGVVVNCACQRGTCFAN